MSHLLKSGDNQNHKQTARLSPSLHSKFSPHKVRNQQSPTSRHCSHNSRPSAGNHPFSMLSAGYREDKSFPVNLHPVAESKIQDNEGGRKEQRSWLLLNRNKSFEQGVLNEAREQFESPKQAPGLRSTIKASENQKNLEQQAKQINKRVNPKQKTQLVSGNSHQKWQPLHSKSVINRLPKSVGCFRLLSRTRTDAISEYFLAIQQTTHTIWTLRVVQMSIFKDQLQALTQLISQIKFQYENTHPFLLQIQHFFTEGDCLYLVEEFTSSGNLYSFNKAGVCSQEEACYRISQLCSAISYLHDNQRVHGGLSPSSIVITLDTCKLTGSQSCDQKTPKLLLLTQNMQYAPLETLLEGVYTKKSDIWALGLIFYYLLTGEELIKDQIGRDIVNSRMNARSLALETLRVGQKVNEKIKQIVENLLQTSPDGRMSSSEILNHQLLTRDSNDRDWNEIFQLLNSDMIKIDSIMKPTLKTPLKPQNTASVGDETTPSFLVNKKLSDSNEQSGEAVTEKEPLELPNGAEELRSLAQQAKQRRDVLGASRPVKSDLQLEKFFIKQTKKR